MGGVSLRGLKSVLIWMVLVYAAYCGVLFFMQRRMLFPRDLIAEPSKALLNVAGMERIWMETGPGRVEAWYLHPAPGTVAGPAPVVIYGHGNAEIIDYWPDEFRWFTDLGMGLLLVEFPGYGRSSGTPSEESITEAFVAAYDRLVSRPDVDASRILLFGRSLGAGAVCQLAARRPSRAMVLLSTFTGTRAFAPRYLIPPFLVRDPFDNLAVVRGYDRPVLVIHGRRDHIIPFSHAEKLAQAGDRVRLIAYDCGHNDCPPDWTRFWRDIQTFLEAAGVVLPVNQAPRPPR